MLGAPVCCTSSTKSEPAHPRFFFVVQIDEAEKRK